MGIDRTITPESYIQQARKLGHEFQLIQNRYSLKMQKLNRRYVKVYSQYKAGQIIDLPEGAKEGYDRFKIEDVVPKITPAEHDGVNITFQLNGQFIDSTGEKPEAKGVIIPQRKKHDEPAQNEAREN